jgi:hypothetical protein
MAFEADWLEREERYRRRVVRLLALGFGVAGIGIAIFAFLQARTAQRARVAAVAAAQAAREREAERARNAFVADSSDAANRNIGFLNRYGAILVSGTPLIQVPLPAGVSVAAYVQQLWPEYARVFDPQATPEQIAEWYRKYYVDVMNDGPLRPSAILLPAIDQAGVKLSMEKPSFPQIAAAQIAVGMRVPAAPDSSDMLGAPLDPAASALPGGANASAAMETPAPEPPPVAEPPPATAAPDSAMNGPRS